MILRCLFVVAVVVFYEPGVLAKKDKSEKEAKAAATTCATCQSVAHLLVKTRKEMKRDTEKSPNEIVGTIFSEREKHVCDAERLASYAEYLEIRPSTMLKKCKTMVPDNMEYKSSQDLRKMLAEAKPRSEVANLLCVKGGRCDALWTKEEEPWQNWNKKKSAQKDEM